MSLHVYRLRSLVSVHDGGSFRAIVDVGFRMYAEQAFRLAGINSPELYGVTHDAATTSKFFLKNRMQNALDTRTDVIVHSHKTEKYGRWLADIYIGGVHVNSEMVSYGYAVEYHP
jgi:micrococcal nuclease